MFDLSVIIVNWNTRELLAQCLTSVVATTGDLRLEIIVVDNASTDGSQAMVRVEHPAVRLIENHANVGFSRANNQGIRVAGGRYVLLLNSDTVVKPGALKALVECLEHNPRAGIVGAELLNPDGALQPSWAAFPTWISEVSGKNMRIRRAMHPPGSGAYQVDWVGGACLLARQEAIASVGLLDERIFMYTEETDWCYRFSRAGWQIVYLAGAQVIHFGGGSSRRSSERSLIELQRSKVYFFSKHYGRLAAELLRLSLRGRALLKMAWTWRHGTSPGTEFYRQRALSRALSRKMADTSRD